MISFLTKWFRIAGSAAYADEDSILEVRSVGQAIAETRSWFWDVWTYGILTVDKNVITVGSLIVGLFFIILGYIAARRLSRMLSRRLWSRMGADRATIATIDTLTFYVLLIFLTLFALKMANVPLTMFTLVGGAVAIGVGFGSQNIVNNFFSGLILMFERPIKLGDFIEVDGIAGTVEDIGIRSTRVLLVDNRHIIVPNSSFLEKNVLNWTHSNNVLRTWVNVGVAYGSPTEKVRELILQAIDGEDQVLKRPEPTVLFVEFGDNSLNFEVLFWIEVKRILDRRLIQSNIRFSIERLFRDNGIVVAFPQRDVHLDCSTPLSVRVLSDKAPVTQVTETVR